MSPLVIGLDLGSSAVRAVAIDADGVVQAKSAVSYRGADTWPSGRADPVAWLAAMTESLNELAHASPAAASPVALGVGGQTPTTVPMDGRFAVTCRHPAGAGLGFRETHQAQRDVLADESGTEVATAESWDWAVRQFGADDRLGLWPGEPTLAGFGEPISSGSSVGRANGDHGLSAGTVLVPGSADAYMSFWTCGIYAAGWASDPGGRTGGLGIALADADCPADMFSIPSAVAGVSIVGGPVNGHGQLLDWWAATSGRSIAEILDAAATVPAGANGALVLPYHGGERAPRWDRRLSGEIHGLNFATGFAEISRAVLESAAYGLAHIAESLATYNISMDVLVCSGSPALSKLWCQIKASVLDVPVVVPADPAHSAAYGGALAAGAAIDWWPGPGSGVPGDWPMPATENIEPAPNAAYGDGYAQFINAGDAAAARLGTPE